jgi:SGNH domain (fused to AT3 domains)
VVGNSHAKRLVPALDRYGEQHGWRILLAAKIDCMGLATSPVGTQSASDPCVLWSAALQRRLLAMPHLDAVIFASHIGARTYLAGPDPSDSDVSAAQNRVLATWTALARRGVRVVVTEDVPGMRPNADPECIARSGGRYDPCAVDRSSVVRPNLMTDLARRHPRLARYEPLSQFFCDAAKCHAVIGGDVVYYDAHHLTTTYSRSLAPYLGAEVAAALASPRPAARQVAAHR